MVPEGWAINKIEDILVRVVDPVDVDPNTYYEQIGIRSHGKGVFYKEAVSGKRLGNKRVFWIKPNCFIVNIVFAWEQAVARTTDHEVGKIASHRFPMYQPKPGQADVDYLVHFFKTPRGKYLLELASPGGAGRNKTLGQKEFANLRFPMPTELEQKKIARILSTWDKAIETVEKLIENSKAQKKTLMQQLLTGKRRLPGFDGKWKFTSFRELFKLANDKTKQVKKSDYEESGDFPVVDQGKKMIAAYVNSSAPYSDIPVIVFGDHTRIVKWVDFHFVPGADGTQLLKTTGKLDLRFAYFLLSNATLPNLGYSRHMRELKEKEFKYPCSLYEQKAIARILEIAEQYAQRGEGLLKMLQAEKKALMQQLLTGRRRVRVEDHQRMKGYGISN